MLREEVMEAILWNKISNPGGSLDFVSSMMWTLARVTPENPDLCSIVAVTGCPNDYSDEELEKLLAFARERTARYDAMFNQRMGANLIIIGKCSDGRWLRKRLTWNRGPMHSSTLDEAISTMSRN